ncbi:hypothetical protein JXM67_11410 [candidate division WOR-3 bacterium]|nr:hypothetical protein [candidate division WOR-3 bacterium]
MRKVLSITAISLIAVLGCKGGTSRLDLLPIDPDFDLHVEAVVARFAEVYEDYVRLRDEYNHHLTETDHDTLEGVEGYEAFCGRESLESSWIDTTLSPIERLDILDAKIDDLVDCAWMLERSFTAHYNRFHGVWNCEWAKFYSPVPDSLAPATYVRCVEENLEGVAGFIGSLRLDFDDHAEEFHWKH